MIEAAPDPKSIPANDQPPAVACANCNLSAASIPHEAELCPICRFPVAASVEFANSGDAGELLVDTLCRQCGYNLRGLSRGGQCPECGRPIADSARRDLLCWADARYVGSLAWGNRLTGIGMTLLLASCCALLLGTFLGVVVAAGIDTLSMMLAICLAVLAVLSAFTGTVLIPIGAFMLSRRPPVESAEDARTAPRRLVRWCLVVMPAPIAIGIFTNMTAPPLPVAAALALLAALLQAAPAVGLASLYRLMSGVCARVPAAKRVSSARALATGFGFSLGYLTLVQVILAVAMWAPALSAPVAPVPVQPGAPTELAAVLWQSVRTLLACGGAIAVLVLLVMLVGAVGLHSRLYATLRAQATIASQPWTISPERRVSHTPTATEAPPQ